MQAILYGPKTKNRIYPDVKISGVHQKAFDVVSHVLKQDDLIPDYTVGKRSESIVYTTKRRNQYAKANMCIHNKYNFNYSGGNAGFYCLSTTPNPDWEWLYYQNHHRACCDTRDTIIGLAKTALGGSFGTSYLGSLGQAHMNTTFDRLRPDLTTVSVPNFLADLDDLGSLVKLWQKRNSLAKNLAGLHLNYKFGWKPTIGDIKDAISGVVAVKSKLEAFEASLGKIIQSHTTIEKSSNTVSANYRVPGGPLQSYRATVTRECIGYIAYKPQPLPVMNSFHKAILSFLDTLGFELNPRIIWDALPFTFVIDWFLGVGNLLGRFKVDTLELPILLVDGFLQYKETLHIEWSSYSDHLVGFVPFPRSGAAAFHNEFFHRMPIYPDYSVLTGLGWKMSTNNQAALLVSLATVLGSK